MDDFDFTEEEIKEQLKKLGYANVPDQRLTQFKRDLEHLVTHERSKDSSACTSSSAEESSRNLGLFNGQTYTSKIVAHDAPRYPLDEASNRQTNSKSNGPTIDYTAFDKENYDKAPVRQHDVTREKAPVYSSYRPPVMHVPSPALDPSMHSLYHQYREHDRYLHMDPHSLADTSIASTTSSERRVIKRRVLRKKDGHSEISDEHSIAESDADDLSQLQQRLHDLPLEDPPHRPYSAPPNYRMAHQEQPSSKLRSHNQPPVYRLPADFEGLKALIRPMTAAPHTKNIRKSDPVARYQQYQQQWRQQKAPGEKKHKNLRWNVREHMLYKDEVVEKKNHQVFVPNHYVIPSDKKRKNLRWNIKNDLAQGVVPPSVYE